MMKPARKGVLARKLTERTLEGRARLYHWLRLNYDELAAAKADLNYTWKDMAETVGEAGARNAFGNPPDAEAVRKAWLKLEAEKAKTVTKGDPKPPQTTQPVTHVPAAQRAPVTGAIEPNKPKPSARSFVVSTPKKEI